MLWVLIRNVSLIYLFAIMSAQFRSQGIITGVGASHWKPTTFIYLTFEKKDPFVYLKCLPIHIPPLIFYIHLLLVVRQI